jgi:hypothetical protein
MFVCQQKPVMLYWLVSSVVGMKYERFMASVPKKAQAITPTTCMPSWFAPMIGEDPVLQLDERNQELFYWLKDGMACQWQASGGRCWKNGHTSSWQVRNDECELEQSIEWGSAATVEDVPHPCVWFMDPASSCCAVEEWNVTRLSQTFKSAACIVGEFWCEFESQGGLPSREEGLCWRIRDGVIRANQQPEAELIYTPPDTCRVSGEELPHADDWCPS